MAFLPDLLTWSREHGFPFYFSTEATVNLADDPTLLAMMEAVDFRYVFVGIETPDKDLLVRTRKRQNTRGSMVDSIHRLHRHGMVVTAGFIVGFDGERRGVAETMAAFVDTAGIPMAMVGLLTALPNTQLTRRLAREGRLPEDYSIQRPGDADQATWGLNFTPSRPAVEILGDYASILRRLYLPERYFGRVLTVARRLRRQPGGRDLAARVRARDREVLLAHRPGRPRHAPAELRGGHAAHGAVSPFPQPHAVRARADRAAHRRAHRRGRDDGTAPGAGCHARRSPVTARARTHAPCPSDAWR
ncbi:MAG: DUF4070 domain-containing protein [Candidatus Rokubacteria bacterium]|nr:DUF4070 domain-containing protein [Candidatus Rokubacteria bacterium]